MIQIRNFIKYCKPLFLSFGLIILIAGCGGHQETNENLKQAFALHEQAVKIRQRTDAQVDSLTTITDSLFVQAKKIALDSINSSLKAWDEQLIEVPGFEEEHDHSGHDHDHHHHHDEHTELTPEQHLQVQQQLLIEIEAIAERVRHIKS